MESRTIRSATGPMVVSTATPIAVARRVTRDRPRPIVVFESPAPGEPPRPTAAARPVELVTIQTIADLKDRHPLVGEYELEHVALFGFGQLTVVLGAGRSLNVVDSPLKRFVASLGGLRTLAPLSIVAGNPNKGFDTYCSRIVQGVFCGYPQTLTGRTSRPTCKNPGLPEHEFLGP
jgi:hypothetical protein